MKRTNPRNNKSITFSVFTKPWMHKTIKELGTFISGLGFDGVEFAVRPGYRLEPQDAAKGLPVLAKQLGDYGLEITSIASNTDEAVFEGCATARIPIIRIMAGGNLETGYFAFMENMKRDIERIIPLCEKYGVKVGIQHHYGAGVNNSMELYQLVGQYDPRYVGAIWDAAHSALAGEEPEQGLEIIRSHLCMVNFKNAYYRRINEADAKAAEWEPYFTLGSQGLSSWARVAEYLKSRSYFGNICLSAEFSEEDMVNKYIAEDIAYAKALFND